MGVRTFGMSTSMHINNQWEYKDGLVSFWILVLLGSRLRFTMSIYKCGRLNYREGGGTFLDYYGGWDY